MNMSRYGFLPAFGVLILLTINSSNAAPPSPFRNRNLIPFPRVGRNIPEKPIDLLTDSVQIRPLGDDHNINRNALWFGPRFGRIQKRKSYLDDPINYLFLRDLSSFKHTPKYTPRLGRDSEEIIEDLNETNQTSY
nr:uncharacterized protein LOC111414359 isoform X2 [Onthophagus taurus]